MEICAESQVQDSLVGKDSQGSDKLRDLNLNLTTIGKLERQNTAFVKVQLVLVRLGVVEHLHIAAFHANSEPFARGTVAEGENLHLAEEESKFFYRLV